MLLPRMPLLVLSLAILFHQLDGVAALLNVLGGFTGSAAATSISFGTGSVLGAAGGLAAAAAAGIAGLGLIALTLHKGRHNDYGSHHGGYAAGYGHEIHSNYGHSSYTGYHRRRRDVSQKFPSYAEHRLAKMFSVVASMDAYGCGLKLVCDLYSSQDKFLTKRELSVKHLLGNKLDIKSTRDPRYAYATAAALGREGFDCGKVYASCPLTKSQVKTYLNSLSL